jgi:energy-converting hydrogenase Eha subunit F
MKFNQNMRRLILFCFFLLTFLSGYSQQASAIYQRGLSAAENLKAIANLGPYSQGGIGFDTRYEGIKGSPRMLDTLLPSFLRLEGQDYYIELMADIDLVKNAVIYIHPKTKQLFSIPGDLISELIINNDGKELVFRTTKGKTFEKEMKEQKFYQVLKDGKYQFIKIPVKIFVQANYKGAYSADRRYDEYQPDARYYLMNADSIFCQIQLNKKSVSKIYPDKKELIDQVAREEANTDKEAMILSILGKF